MNKQERQIEIGKIVINTSFAIADQIKIAYPKKMIFRPVKRRPMSKKRKSIANARIALLTMMSAAQLHRIVSIPSLPNYPSGSFNDN